MLLKQESDVNSSMIEKAIYNFETSTLKIRFTNGSLYEYNNVPNEVYDNFCKSDSQGKFLNEKIKNQFTHNKLITD